MGYTVYGWSRTASSSIYAGSLAVSPVVVYTTISGNRFNGYPLRLPIFKITVFGCGRGFPELCPEVIYYEKMMW